MARDHRVNANTPNTHLRNEITTDLRALASDDLVDGATKLFNTLGYTSTRLGPDADDNSPKAFLEHLRVKVNGSESEKEFLKEVSSVKLLFQVTNSEIQSAGKQTADLFGNIPSEMDTSDPQSFFFAIVQLKGKSYARGVYARVAREINKSLAFATVVLMRNANGNVSLAFVDRRPHKRQRDRAVLGNVALLREMDVRDPHRAHTLTSCPSWHLAIVWSGWPTAARAMTSPAC